MSEFERIKSRLLDQRQADEMQAALDAAHEAAERHRLAKEESQRELEVNVAKLAMESERQARRAVELFEEAIPRPPSIPWFAGGFVCGWAWGWFALLLLHHALGAW